MKDTAIADCSIGVSVVPTCFGSSDSLPGESFLAHGSYFCLGVSWLSQLTIIPAVVPQFALWGSRIPKFFTNHTIGPRSFLSKRHPEQDFALVSGSVLCDACSRKRLQEVGLGRQWKALCRFAASASL